MVLHVAARWGSPELALDVIKTLQSMQVTWQEHHFAPVIEAFCRQNQVKQAFEVLGTIRDYHVTPDSGTAYPIYKAISGNVSSVDAAWKHLDDLHADGKRVDALALDVVLRAAVRIQDLQRALGIYKAYPDFNASPSIDTFNILLVGCTRVSQRQLGDKLMTEMTEAGIKPNAKTYEGVIELCLSQPTYEDAFYYLEEMKAEGFTPPPSTYVRIIKKCVLNGDSRHQLAMEEMRSLGYEIPKSLQAFIDSGGKDAEDKPDTSETFAAGRPLRREHDVSLASNTGIIL